MLWKFPHNAHMINLEKVEVLSPITTVVTPAEGNFAETRKCLFTVTVSGNPIEIAVVDYDPSGMLTAEAWNQRLDELEADYDALVWQFLGEQTPPAEPADTGGIHLVDEALVFNTDFIQHWSRDLALTPEGKRVVRMELHVPDGYEYDQIMNKLTTYAQRAQIPDIPLDLPLGSAAL